MPNSRFALRGKRPSLIHGLCAFFASNSRFMRLFQAALDTPLDSPFSATLSVHGLHFTVCAPSSLGHFPGSLSPGGPVASEKNMASGSALSRGQIWLFLVPMRAPFLCSGCMYVTGRTTRTGRRRRRRRRRSKIEEEEEEEEDDKNNKKKTKNKYDPPGIRYIHLFSFSNY